MDDFRRAVLATLCALVVAGAPLLLPLVFGPRYAYAVPVFQLLVLAYGVQATIWPVLTVLMVLDRPKIIAALNLIMLLMVSVGYVIVVPSLGATGAAIMLLGAYVLI